MTSRRRNKAPTRRQTIVTLLVLYGCLLVAIWAVTGPWRDAQDLTWVKCQVVDAKVQRGDNHSSVPWYVAVDTTDCGVVVYQVGTNEDNVEGVAELFEPGPYEFKFGAVSQRIAEGRTFLDDAADAKDFRRLPADEHGSVSDR